MNFSVLICTYNRHEMLGTALASLLAESDEKPDQVVVVNGGDDLADRVVKGFQHTPGVEVVLVRTVNKNLAASRNLGLPHCHGDIIAMTDDDAQVFPDWVTLMKRVHTQHPEAGAVGGPVIGTNTDSLVGKVADAITFPSWTEAQYVRTLPGVNISYKREVVEQLGEQDESLFRGEDVDYNWRMLQAGYPVWFDPAVKVYHHHRPSVKGFLNQHYMYGRAYYLVRNKWRDMYCIYPHGIHSARDLLKLGNFLLMPAYQPLLNTRKIEEVSQKIKALPLLLAACLAWQGGMVQQALSRKTS